MIVMLNKMDRSDAAPFAELEVRTSSSRMIEPPCFTAPQQKLFADTAAVAAGAGSGLQAGNPSARHVRCFSTSLAHSQGHQVAAGALLLLILSENVRAGSTAVACRVYTVILAALTAFSLFSCRQPSCASAIRPSARRRCCSNQNLTMKTRLASALLLSFRTPSAACAFA